MTGVYAADTSVSVEKSRIEIEHTLQRYGADAFAYSIDGPLARIAFRLKDRQYRFSITLPPKSDRRFTHHSRGMRSPDAALKEWERACRQKWRALALVIKAKLEAVSAGISSVEDEFMAALVLPNGATMADEYRDQIATAYLEGAMPKRLMLEGPGREP